MSFRMPAGLSAATRLVRDGKLMDATAAIQRALKGEVAESTTQRDGAEVIEGTWRIVEADCGVPLRPGQTIDEFGERATLRTPAPGGRFITSSYTNHAGTRRYKTYIPTQYHGQALPLIIMLHGCKQGPDDFAAGTRMNALAEEHGFIVVYPAQVKNANASNCWNWFQPADQQRDTGEPSLIAGITREVAQTYKLDSRRVYIAGLSAGGAMAAIMATTYPDLYAAVGVHSGLAHGSAADIPSAFAAMRGEGMLGARTRTSSSESARRTIPAIVFHGDNDTTVHPSNGERVIAQGAAPFRSEDKTAQAQSTIVQGKSGGRTYTRTTHVNDGGKSIMEHWVVHGAGHAWSGGSARGSFADEKGPDASREMLRFFLQHP
ncbi:MAG: PHB depolymerase family esterase [Pseudomonadota bacterium]